MIRAFVIGSEEVIARLGQIEPKVSAEIDRTSKSLALQLLRKIKEEKLSGQVLKNQTGTLRRSISYRRESTSDGISDVVYTNKEYARIHEYGGVTKPHVIRPRFAKALAFQVGGNAVFAKSVNHPGSKVPERSFMRSALAEMRPTIQREFTAAVARALK